MGRKKININIEVGDEIEKAMEGFKPRFGSDEDIAIINTLGELKHLLTTLGELKHLLTAQATDKEDIKEKQANLLWLIERRNGALSTESPELSPDWRTKI